MQYRMHARWSISTIRVCGHSLTSRSWTTASGSLWCVTCPFGASREIEPEALALRLCCSRCGKKTAAVVLDDLTRIFAASGSREARTTSHRQSRTVPKSELWSYQSLLELLRRFLTVTMVPIVRASASLPAGMVHFGTSYPIDSVFLPGIALRWTPKSNHSVGDFSW